MNKKEELLLGLKNCETACLSCATECLQEEEVSMLAKCIETDLSCADFCAFTARALVRKDSRATDVVKLCMEICGECARECEKHDHDHCKRCAQACRVCEKLCKEYLSRN